MPLPRNRTTRPASRPNPGSGGAPGHFLAFAKEQLHPQANADERRASLYLLLDRLNQARAGADRPSRQ